MYYKHHQNLISYNHTSAFLEFYFESLYSSGSGCPFPRSAKSITASVIATPIAVPYAASPASAMKYVTQNQQ